MLTKLFLALLILVVCNGCGKNDDFWCYQVIKTQSSAYDSKRIYHTPNDIICHLEFEIIKDCRGVHGFVNSFNNSYDLDGSQAAIKIGDGSERLVPLFKFCGNQHFMLPTVETKLIINALLCNKCVSIAIPGSFSILLKPSNFRKAWKYTPPIIGMPGFLT